MPTPSDHLEGFLQVRDRVRGHQAGAGGAEVCALLTQEMDVALAALLAGTSIESDVALVATGGYGRAELSLYSDIDVMVLHDVEDPADLAAAVFRPLWDAGLRVGHSVRTVPEASLAAREKVDTHTTLLTTRLIAGSETLYETFSAEIAKVTKARPLTRHLASAEAHRRKAAPFLLMATDVKEGRAGLRTLQGFRWERRREELIGRFTPESTPDETAAYETLLRIRNALHAVTGRPHDVFSADLREAVARWLEVDILEVAGMLVEAMLTADRLATERWPELVEDQGRGRLRRRRRRDAPIEVSVPLDEDGLVTLLQSGEAGRARLERLHRDGSLEDVLPAWEVVRSHPQLAPFHEHPVEAHLWRTVGEMRALINDKEHYSPIAEEVGSNRALLLSAFFHDIGKGAGGDHSIVGSEIAVESCSRLGCDPETVSLVAGAVRHHLLLSQTATRRDLDDPAVLDEVVNQVGDLRLLQTLYLLTVADSKATGPTMWNTWKETLLRTVFVRCATRFGADRPAYERTGGVEIDDLPPDRRPQVQEHLRSMPGEYARSVTVDDVLWHLDVMGADSDPGMDLRQGEGAQTAVVVGSRREGFRLRVAESFAANGIDVLEARMSSRDDGTIVDVFQIRDDITGGPVSTSKWERARADVAAAMSGGLDTGSKVATRAAAYESREPNGAEPKVSVSLDSATGDTVITVRCPDRIGRLAEILDALYGCGLDIGLAKLDSRGGQVVDTFHVIGESEVDLPLLERRIGEAIRA